jgi:hypothetical protein
MSAGRAPRCHRDEGTPHLFDLYLFCSILLDIEEILRGDRL